MFHSLTTSRAAGQALAWLLTYAVHSTVLLAMAWAVTHRLGARRLRLQETIWRWALVGGLVTASAQLAFGHLGHAPIAGRWALVVPDATAVSAAASPVSGATVPAGKLLGAAGAPGAGAPGAGTPGAGTPGAAGAAASATADAAAGSWAPAGQQPAARAVAGPGRREAGQQPGQQAIRGRRVPLGASLAPGAAGGPRRGPRSAERGWLAKLESMLLPAWLLGALALTLGSVRSYLSLRRRLRYRPQVVGGGVLARLAFLVRGSGMSRRVRLTCTWRLRVPVALGLRVAEVCVPPRVLFQLDDEQQDALLAHELAHLVRRDPVWLPLTQLMVGICFFQPLNWLARRRLRELSELLCDEWAVSRTGRPLSLAACLAEVAGWSLAALGANGVRRYPGHLPVPGMADRPSQLAHRIRRLLAGVTPDGRGPDRRRLGVVLAAVLVAVTLAAPGIYAGSSATAPTLASAGRRSPAVTPATASAVPLGAPQASVWAPASHAEMVVAAMAPAVEQGPEGAAATAPAAAPAPSAAPAAAPAPAPAPAVAPSPDAERERLAAAAGRLEQLDKLSTLSQEQLEAISATVERISREIDGKLGEELERLNHQMSAVRAAAPHGDPLPAAELSELDAELAGLTAQLHPSAKEMADLDARLRALDAELPHLSAEEMKRVQNEAKRGLEQMHHLGLSQAEIDRMHAELGRALEEVPKARLSHEEIEHLRADVKRAVEESAAAMAHGLSRAEREKIVADARRLAEQMRPDQAQLEALRALQHEHEKLSRALAEQRAEIEAVRREILQQTEALRDQARRLTESRGQHPKARPDRHARPAAPPAAPTPPSHPAAAPPPPPGGPGATSPSNAAPPPAPPDSSNPPPGACEP
jgi:hypothetical protein